MRLATIVTASLLLAALGAGAGAAEENRYTLEKSASGYVRMDTQTGEMSICEERSAQLICKLAADERSAFQGDVDQLQATLAALENSLPTEEEFEKTMSYMERFFRGFIGIVKELDEETPTPESLPQKT